jgi:DNA-binding CsgD family transcriptional regulator
VVLGRENRGVGVLIEREAELALLGEVLAAARAGRGGAVLVEGEAGIGKTRLLAWAREEAVRAGSRVLPATADEIEAGVPLAVARLLLARAAREVTSEGPVRLARLVLDGELAEPGALGSRADEVVHALWWLVVELTEERPLVLVVDDAQWADELTLAWLRVVARRASELPLALLVAARPAGLGQRHGVLSAERAFERVRPAPLSIAGTSQLVEELLEQPGPGALAGRVRELAGGNPLYVSELVAWAWAGGEEVIPGLLAGGEPPPELVRLVEQRLDRLSPAAAALARAVAVLGADADPRRARALAGLDGTGALAAEEELRAERIFDAREYGFVHPVVAAATRASIGAAPVAELHAQAAALLLDQGVDEQRVAEHLMAAPPRGDATAVSTMRKAAEAARRLGAPAAAARLLERALAEPPLPEQEDTVAFERGRALLDAGSPDAQRALERVARDAREPPLRAIAARHLARQLALDGRSDEAATVLSGVLGGLGDGDRQLRLELLAEAAVVAGSARGGRERAMAMLADEAERVSWRTPGERLLAVAARVVAAEMPADPAAGASALLALRLHRDFPGSYAVGDLTFSATSVLLNADALDDAERAMDQLRADAEQTGQPHLVAGALWQQAQIAYQRGDLRRCRVEARAAGEAAGAFARRLAVPWSVMALAEQGELADAERLLATEDMLETVAASPVLVAAVGSRGRLRLAQGRLDLAIDDLAEARDRSRARFARLLEPPWQPLLAEGLALADRTDEASEEARDYAARAAEWGTRRALGHAARLRALVAPRPRAITLLEEARAHFTASHARLELARCLTELGTHRRAAGERTAARAVLRDAHDTAQACGAMALCARARGELLLAGGRPRPPAGAGVHALTPAERRIAELAAQGAANREIARRLYLSPKTVEMHLRSCYRKLDVTGRTDLPGALAAG